MKNPPKKVLRVVPKIEIIRGNRLGTFTLGFLLPSGPHRDSRFGPALSWREAEWLLENETKRKEVEARFANRTKRAEGKMA